MIDWKAVFDAYPDDVDSVIAKRLGVATSTVWKARTNRKGKSRRDSQIFVRCPVDVRTAIIEAAEMGEGSLSVMRPIARPSTPSRTASDGVVLALPDEP